MQAWGLYRADAPAAAGALPLADKLGHVLIFAAPAALAVLLGGRAGRIVLAALVLHAPLSELLQHALLGGRSGDLVDVLADLFGVALGVWLGAVLAGRRLIRDGISHPRRSGA